MTAFSVPALRNTALFVVMVNTVGFSPDQLSYTIVQLLTASS